MNQITTVTLVRHAQADAAVLDPAARPLTETGRADTRRLAEFLRKDGLTALYSSDYVRARDTLAPTAEALGLPLNIDPGLREWRAGAIPKDMPFFDHVRDCWARPDVCRAAARALRGLRTVCFARSRGCALPAPEDMPPPRPTASPSPR